MQSAPVRWQETRLAHETSNADDAKRVVSAGWPTTGMASCRFHAYAAVGLERIMEQNGSST